MPSPRKSPMKCPKGYRTIVVDGQTWYWTHAHTLVTLVARNAVTRERVEANHEVIDRLQRELGVGAWDDRRECNMIEPRHVAGFLKDVTRWQPAQLPALNA